MILQILLAFLSLLSTCSAFSREEGVTHNCLDSGVWIGQIGNKPVTLSFSMGGGRYYYGTRLQDLVLQRDPGQSTRWLEFDMDGDRTATIDLTCHESLHGKWISVGSDKEFEINATPFLLNPENTSEATQDPEIDAQSNESRSYLNARLLALPEAQKKAMSFYGKQYSILKVQGLSTTGVELPENYAGASEIDRELRADFDRNVEGEINCSYWWLVLSGPKHGISFTAGQRIVFWREPNVIVASETSYCLGDFITGTLKVTLFNTRTGSKEYAMGPWIDERYRKGIGNSPLLEVLSPYYLASQSGKLPKCEYFLKGKIQIIEWPEQHGMAIDISSIPGVTDQKEKNLGTDCDTVLSIPYSKVIPFLSDTGKAKLNALLSKR